METPRYLLDTHSLSELIKRPAGTIARRVSAMDPAEICTSIVVAAELRFGAAKKGSAILTGKVEQLLSTLQVFPLGRDFDRHYAEIRWHLEKAGQSIGANALIIAAQARALDLALVTANVGEFGQVPGVIVENWLTEPYTKPDQGSA